MIETEIGVLIGLIIIIIALLSIIGTWWLIDKFRK